uniref:Uncharacterized protein n=1 Tax=Rhizophora mucronata TaxID=61149 RepID=A0A2P2KAG6_RHIMU
MLSACSSPFSNLVIRFFLHVKVLINFVQGYWTDKLHVHDFIYNVCRAHYPPV